jgi:hypothetical protein
MERAGRLLTGSAEKLPAGNFLEFSFLRARAGPRGFRQASQAIRSERTESRKLPAGNLADAFIMALLAAAEPGSFVLAQNLRVVFPAFNDDFRRRRSRQESFEVHSDPERQGGYHR